MHKLRHSAIVLSLAAIAGCGKDATSEPTDDSTLSSIPVEGFSGFNPALAPGRFVVTVSVTGSPRHLDVSVSQPVEN